MKKEQNNQRKGKEMKKRERNGIETKAKKKS